MTLDLTPPIPGRQVDLGIFNPTNDTTALLDGAGGIGMAGLAKLAQMVVISLYTEQGADPFAPTTGTIFPGLLRANQVQTVVDVRSIFDYARKQLLLQFFDRDIGRPDDERLADVTLLSAKINQSELILALQITSVAGERGDITFPIYVS